MTFQQHWEALQARHPALLNDGPVSLNPAALRDALEQAFRAGARHEQELWQDDDYRLRFAGQ